MKTMIAVLLFMFMSTAAFAQIVTEEKIPAIARDFDEAAFYGCVAAACGTAAITGLAGVAITGGGAMLGTGAICSGALLACALAQVPWASWWYGYPPYNGNRHNLFESLDTRPITVVPDPGRVNVQYQTTAGKVLKTVDGGETWTPLGPQMILNKVAYCVGDRWQLDILQARPAEPIDLRGVSGGQEWNIARWKQTDGTGTLRESGIFDVSAVGTHLLLAVIGGTVANVVSFEVADCGGAK